MLLERRINYSLGQKSWDTFGKARANYASFHYAVLPHLPLKMLILTSLIGALVVNIVWGWEGTLNTVETAIPKVFIKVHVMKYKVCAFCMCLSKVSQALLVRIIAITNNI